MQLPDLALQPKPLRPPEWGSGGFDYSRIVQPVLDEHCTKCHNPQDAPKGIDLTGDETDYFNVSYDVLARENQGRTGSPYVNWIPTYNGHEQNILVNKPLSWGSPKSKLAEIVLGAHVDKAGKPRFTMDVASQKRVLAWIDLNVPYYHTASSAYVYRMGCRRNNFPFASDFPRFGGRKPRGGWFAYFCTHTSPCVCSPGTLKWGRC